MTMKLSSDGAITAIGTPAWSGAIRFGTTGITTIGETKDVDHPTDLTRSFECKAFDISGRTADFVASTDAIDSHDEIIDQSTWELGDYLKNPIVLFGHLSRDLPIGTCVDVAVRNNRLECRIKFATEEMNPLAEQVWKMVQAKILRAVSVGFIPKSYRIEMRDGREILVWSSCILKEISVVPVPANGEALAKMKAKAFDKQPPAPLEAIPNTTEAAAPRKDKDIMTEKELLAKVEELTEKNSGLAIQVGAIGGERDAAKKSASEAETKAKALESENTSLKTDNGALLLRIALGDECVVLHLERADELEAKTIEQEVDALVGKQITAAEKPLFVDLRKSNPELFTKMVAQRQPMRLEEQVVPKEKTNGAGSTAHLAAKLKGA